MSKLQPCPFCGSKNVHWTGINSVYYVACEDCHANGPHAPSDGIAISRWNERHVPLQLAMKAQHPQYAQPDAVIEQRRALGTLIEQLKATLDEIAAMPVLVQSVTLNQYSDQLASWARRVNVAATGVTGGLGPYPTRKEYTG